MKRLDNKGWGLNEFLLFLLAFFVCLVIVIVLCNQLMNKENKAPIVDPIISGGKTDIGDYIELEDRITEQAKLYNNSETEDTVIIKLNNLVKNGYIKKVIDPKNNKECSGYVVYNGQKKEYKTYLSCPGNYQTSDYNKDLE